MNFRTKIAVPWTLLLAVFLPACRTPECDETHDKLEVANVRIAELEELASRGELGASEHDPSHPPGVQYVPAANALGPYSSAVVVGDLALLSGKIGERGQSFAHEVETCLDAVEETLRQMGLSFSDCVEARVYLTDMGRYAEFNEIYGRRLSAPYPARTCVAVAGLPGGARVEVQVAARR